jgi:hypothetical protein
LVSQISLMCRTSGRILLRSDAIISDLLHCNKVIVQCTHEIVNPSDGVWFEACADFCGR